MEGTPETPKTPEKKTMLIPLGSVRDYAKAESLYKSSKYNLEKNQKKLLEVPAAYQSVKENLKDAEKQMQEAKEKVMSFIAENDLSEVIMKIKEQFEDNQTLYKNYEAAKNEQGMRQAKKVLNELKLFRDMVEDYVLQQQEQGEQDSPEENQEAA